MGAYAETREQRIKVRKDNLDLALAAISRWADAEGVVFRIFGSYVRGRVNPDSDLDILVMSGFTPATRFRVTSGIEGAAEPYDIPVDVAFFDMSPYLFRDSVKPQIS